MAGPWLVGVAHRRLRSRTALHGDYAPLVGVGDRAGARGRAVRLLRSVFVMRSGGSARTCCYDLRAREFDHAQPLSVAFHERYTSGRVISRLTRDVDTLPSCSTTGLDGLLTALLNIAAIAVHLLVLDVPLAPDRARARSSRCAAGALVLAARRARRSAHPRDGGRADREHRRDPQRHPRGAGLPPREAQRRDLRRAQRRTTARPTPTPSGCRRCSSPARAGRQRHDGRGAARRGAAGASTAASSWACSTAFLLYLRQFYDPMEDARRCSTTRCSRRPRPWRRSPRVLAERPDVPEPADAGRAAARPVRGEIAFDGVELRLPRRPRRCCPTSTSTSRPGRPSRWSAPPARARPPSPS